MRTLQVMAAAGLLLVANGEAVEAAPFTVAGSTYGAFDGAEPSDSASLGPMIFTGATFEVSTADDGDGSEYANSEPPNHFGAFSLMNTPFTFTDHAFALTFDFTEPLSASPDPATVGATLLGRVRANGAGGVSIFYDGPTLVTFATGSFWLGLNDVTLAAGESNVAQRGYIEGYSSGSATAVPEPMSLLLLGTGVGTLAVARGRRRSAVGRVVTSARSPLRRPSQWDRQANATDPGPAVVLHP